MTTVRYMVEDVDAAVTFYTESLGFTLVESFGAPFARVEKDGLDLWLAGPSSSAARPMPDGGKPGPGGWNRIVVLTDDIERDVRGMKDAGVRFRNDVVRGPGGSQVVIEDPSGNPIELFQPREAT
ncbi:MAG: VOC family protein [Armatimonadetes bacterium]|nr:VOC family protein [Armatimonadota bacterium]